jgi:hypothetical protein
MTDVQPVRPAMAANAALLAQQPALATNKRLLAVADSNRSGTVDAMELTAAAGKHRITVRGDGQVKLVSRDKGVAGGIKGFIATGVVVAGVAALTAKLRSPAAARLILKVGLPATVAGAAYGAYRGTTEGQFRPGKAALHIAGRVLFACG